MEELDELKKVMIYESYLYRLRETAEKLDKLILEPKNCSIDVLMTAARLVGQIKASKYVAMEIPKKEEGDE